MRPTRPSFVVLLIAFLAIESRPGECQTAQSTEPKRAWLESWRSATFSFGQIKKQNGRDYFEVIGTGVLITPDRRSLYIVTAKHVFDDPKKKWHPKEIRLRFAWQERSSVYDDLGISVNLLDSSDEARWLASEDGADLAAIPISIQDLRVTGKPYAIHTDLIVMPEDMFEGASVLALGYPGIIGNEYLVRAIARGGIVAWLNPEDPHGKPFMIDANIYPENSGGPVIKPPTGFGSDGGLNLGGRIRLMGIVSQAPGLDTDLILTVPGAPQPLRIRQNVPLGGTGLIEPATKIPALLKRFLK
jgi:hypothetical protein